MKHAKRISFQQNTKSVRSDSRRCTCSIHQRYSWDCENHKQWVLDLSNDLREKYRVYTLLDRYNHGGDDLPTFMLKGLKRADRVLIIGTPKYKEKLENSNNGGAKFED